MREHSWYASRAESPERSPPHAHLDRNHAAFSKYQVLAELHAEERKTGGDATSHRLNSAPLSTTQRTASTGDGLQHTVSTRVGISRGHSRIVRNDIVIPKSPGEASKRGGGEAESPNAAQLKQRGKEGSVDAVDWQELLNEHQQRIAQARSQGKIVRKLSPAVEAARVAAERLRLEKKEQEKAAILEAQEQLKNSMKGPRPRVAHTLDPDLESAWERKRQEKDNNRKEFCKKTNTDSQTFASRLADIKSKVADLREFTPEEKAQREALFSKREAAKRRAEMKLKSDNEDFMRTISGAKPRTQARLTEEDMRTRSQAKQNFANGKYHQQELKLQYDVAIELRRKMFRGAFKVSKETQEKIYLKGRDAAVAAMKMAGRAK
uniref:Uncharacterized protein n=1 Tax=Tetraselmis chuii TaxID=63592 RepID=A0A7S1SUC7_9CHLO